MGNIALMLEYRIVSGSQACLNSTRSSLTRAYHLIRVALLRLYMQDGSVVDVGRRVSAVLDADRMLREKPSPVLVRIRPSSNLTWNLCNEYQ